MKYIAICILFGISSGYRLSNSDSDDIWGDVVSETDYSTYIKEEPKAYMEKDKPRINYALIQKQKRA